MISETELNNLKKNVPLWQVVEERIPLATKEGKNYCFRCPFHDGDRSPSFKVTQTADGTWLYKCFGCNASGNVFQFIEKFDKIGFQEAQEKVASLAEWDGGRQQVEKTFRPLFDKKETAKTFELTKLLPFEEALANSAAGLAWLKSRGFTLENAKNFHLGYVQSVESWAPGNRVAKDGWILFPTIEGDQVVSLKYRSVKDKEFLRKPGMVTTLFNLKAVVPFDDVFLTEGECCSGDTEVLTTLGWVRLDKYRGGLVAQWEPSGAGGFVQPLSVVKKKHFGEMVHFTSPTRIVDLLVTPNHRIVFESEAHQRLTVLPAKDVPKGSARFFRTVSFRGDGLASWKDEELRLQVMIQADASWENPATNINHHLSDGKKGWRAEFSKSRKIVRCRKLLQDAGVPWTEWVTGRKTTCFRFRTDQKFLKEFPGYFYNMCASQRISFLTEVRFWDTHRKTNGAWKYTSVVKSNADLVQTLAVCSGISAILRAEQKTGNRYVQFYVCVASRAKRGEHLRTSARSIQKKYVAAAEPYVYCVQVPSSFILTRRNGVVTVTGNCDAIALAEAGYVATALPGASTNLTPEMRDKLLRADTIYLAGDMDDAGKQAMNKLWAELGARTYRIEWPEVKDANEYLLKACQGDVEKFRAGVEALKRKARATPLPFFYDLQESIRNADTSNPMENPRRMHFVQPTVDMMAINLPGAVIYSYATETGSGKTSWWSEQLLNEAIKHNSVVINYSCELSPDEYARLVTAQLTGRDRLNLRPEDREVAAEKLKNAQFFVGYNPDANRIGQVLDSLEWAIRRLGANIVILDHINFLSRGEKDEYKAQSDAMQRIKNLAVKYQVIFIVIGQSRKSNAGGYRKASELSDGKGSESLSSDASAVYHIHRERIRDIDPLNPPSDLLKPEVEIRLYKSRAKGPGAGFANLFFHGATGRFIEVGAPIQELS